MPVHVTVQEQKEKASLNSPGGDELMAKLGGKDGGLPFYAFLDAHGEALVNSLRPGGGNASSANIGYPAKPEEIDWFMAMLRKAVPAMPASDSALLERWLREHSK